MQMAANTSLKVNLPYSLKLYRDYYNSLTLSNIGKLKRTRVVKLIPDIFVLYAPKNMKLIL